MTREEEGALSWEEQERWRMIVSRYKERGNRLPRLMSQTNMDTFSDPCNEGNTEEKSTSGDIAYTNASNSNISEEEQIERKDALVLRQCKETIDKTPASALRPGDLAIIQYLDSEMPGWRNIDVNSEEREVASVDTTMEIARGIYDRYLARGCLPEHQRVTNGDPEKVQENEDAVQLSEWKQALLGGWQKGSCPDSVIDFLDEHIPEWRDKFEKLQAFNQRAMAFAEGIVARYEARGRVMPVRSKECKLDPARAQEYRDAAKLNDWKQSLKGNKTKTICNDEVKAFLDARMPSWREVTKDTHHDPMLKAVEIVERYRARGNIMPREWREHRDDPDRAQEYKDASKLRNWKRALKGNGTHNCPDVVRDYLDAEMPDWRKEVRKKYCNPMVTAREIVERYNQRNKILPRHFSSNRKDPARLQEYKDAKKLYDWKQGLKGLRFYRCSPELKAYLDANLPGWNDGVYSKASLLAESKNKGNEKSSDNELNERIIEVSSVNTKSAQDETLASPPVEGDDSLKRLRSDDEEDRMTKQDDSPVHSQVLPQSKIPRVMETKEV